MAKSRYKAIDIPDFRSLPDFGSLRGAPHLTKLSFPSFPPSAILPSTGGTRGQPDTSRNRRTLRNARKTPQTKTTRNRLKPNPLRRLALEKPRLAFQIARLAFQKPRLAFQKARLAFANGRLANHPIHPPSPWLSGELRSLGEQNGKENSSNRNLWPSH